MLKDILKQLQSKQWVSNPRSAKLYYAACDHICKLSTKAYYKITQQFSRFGIPVIIFARGPANQPTITGVALCHKRIGRSSTLFFMTYARRTLLRILTPWIMLTWKGRINLTYIIQK